MPRTIRIEHLPIGVAMSHSLPGEQVTVRMKELLSSEDGGDFIARLEELSNFFGPVLREQKVTPSRVDNLLAVVTKDREATVYCNELRLVVKVRTKKLAVQAGEYMFKDDIADVAALDLLGPDGAPVGIPADCGFALILSHGWRKGLLYDFSVFRADSPDRADDLPRLFGQLYAQLLFQEVYTLTEEQWRRLTEWGWFPFICLRDQDRKRLISWSSQERVPHPVFDEICQSFQPELERKLESWKADPLFDPHMGFLGHAKDSYLRGDYLGCISVLYPRIEGVLRTLFVQENPSGRPTQGSMVENLVENQYPHSVLLPHRFREYLIKVYFREFDQSAGSVPLSRHSVSHGIAAAQDYDFVKASLGFMTLDQVFYYLSD
jgi:hypothetical protein